jgi:ribosomal protein L37E
MSFVSPQTEHFTLRMSSAMREGVPTSSTCKAGVSGKAEVGTQRHMSALQQPILMVCAMCGRDQFERPGSWATATSSVYPDSVHLCEADAANFDPVARYDPIAMERYSGVSSCRTCGHRHYVMEAGSTVFICASCGSAAPPLLVTPSA